MTQGKISLWLALILILSACQPSQADHVAPATSGLNRALLSAENAAIADAFYAKKSNLQVSGKGLVNKLLNDDNKGARHQKFLVKLSAQQTLLFAHNIDLAPRVPLAVGDEISFYGEYEFNPKGGIIHWTHHAPRGDHEAGWIMHKGIKYQ